MACIVADRRFHCTTSDVWFGPRFESDEEGEKFLSWLYATKHSDPRIISEIDLNLLVIEFRNTKEL